MVLRLFVLHDYPEAVVHPSPFVSITQGGFRTSNGQTVGRRNFKKKSWGFGCDV